MDLLNQAVQLHARKSPDRVALSFGDVRYTYQELDNEIERYAGLLRQHGLCTGSRVGLQLPNSDLAVIALFAILRAGACAVSLNPMLRPRETIDLCCDAAVSGMIITAGQYEGLRRTDFQREVPALNAVCILPEDGRSAAAEAFVWVKAPLAHLSTALRDSGDDAMIVYTSGTSGRAKGVVLTHQNLWDKVETASEVMGITGEDRALMILPLCHVFALTRQLFPHLVQGARVEIAAVATPPDLVNHLIDGRRITTFSGVPYHFHGMLQRGAGKRYSLASLRLATSSSMKLHADLRRRLAKALPHVKFSAQYGLTETSGFVTALAPELFIEKPDSVGRCIAGVEAKMCEGMQPSLAEAVGESVGELLVRGRGIMSRYFNRPDATAAVLDQDGWLRTGDLASIDRDGDIAILSRKQFVIKRAGEFVIPEEVEALIASHEAVDEVCVFGVPDDAVGESVGAAVVLNRREATAAHILEYCRHNLAAFKIPKEIIVVDALERTYTNKVNKHAMLQHYVRVGAGSRRGQGALPGSSGQCANDSSV